LRGLSSAGDRPPARSRAQPDAEASGKLGDKVGADRLPTAGELGSGTCFVVGWTTMRCIDDQSTSRIYSLPSS
jgi:hypothetical protein